MGGAGDFDEGPELVHLETRLLLRLMVELVGHVSQVVADPATHGNGDVLALASVIAFAPRPAHRK